MFYPKRFSCDTNYIPTLTILPLFLMLNVHDLYPQMTSNPVRHDCLSTMVYHLYPAGSVTMLQRSYIPCGKHIYPKLMQVGNSPQLRQIMHMEASVKIMCISLTSRTGAHMHVQKHTIQTQHTQLTTYIILSPTLKHSCQLSRFWRASPDYLASVPSSPACCKIVLMSRLFLGKALFTTASY